MDLHCISFVIVFENILLFLNRASTTLEKDVSSFRRIQREEKLPTQEIISRLRDKGFRLKSLILDTRLLSTL
ncbi:unnamed protein product [Allacma fusca]|uniref:Uncharacterized protein n=1 Tax=Allacma fusca TaxID=39272 RepID=A0A8J2LHY8_9HEXA|nr:unnamed protein product [Allacma fusca]